MDEEVYSWPDTCLYEALSKEIAHAIGVISINWQFVESVQEQLIHHYLGVDAERARLLTTHLSNDARSGLLKGLLESLEIEQKFKDAINRFLACFEAAKPERWSRVSRTVSLRNEPLGVLAGRTTRTHIGFPDTIAVPERLKPAKRNPS